MFQTTTACHRDDKIDYLHSEHFMKNELIKTDVVNKKELKKMIDICLEFYQNYIPMADVKKTTVGYDIVYRGYELGSYGIRENEFLSWIYGTGCAEPRLSKLTKLYKQRDEF